MTGWFANKSIERLHKMLKAISSQDFSFRIPEEKLRGPEKHLAEEMNAVMTGFRKRLMDQERRYGQYETYLDTIDIAIIATGQNGNIRFMNRKAIESLCGFRIDHLSDLAAIDSGLPRALSDLTPGESKILPLDVDGKGAKVKIAMVKYRTEGNESYIYSIEYINRLLLENEIEAQRKLISVITHEIMNSLSPIISLSETMCDAKNFSDEEMQLALSTIKRRSQGLLSFVSNYRKLSQLAPPNLQWVSIGEIFDGLKRLFPEPSITFELSDPDIQLRLDRHQIEQVMINLIKNGIEACSDAPEIFVSAKPDHPGRRFIISVTDNGCGIDQEDSNRIFVPFFTTKPGGSGIGLSISRQIINSHGGILKLEPSESGSNFTIQLPLVYRL